MTVNTRSNNIKHQLEGWHQMLDNLVQENISLKQSLTQLIMDTQYTKEELEIIESYQNSFVNKDACILLLRQDIVAFQTRTEALTHEDTSLEYQQQKLQFEVTMMCEQFRRLKATFEQQFAIG